MSLSQHQGTIADIFWRPQFNDRFVDIQTCPLQRFYFIYDHSKPIFWCHCVDVYNDQNQLYIAQLTWEQCEINTTFFKQQLSEKPRYKKDYSKYSILRYLSTSHWKLSDVIYLWRICAGSLVCGTAKCIRSELPNSHGLTNGVSSSQSKQWISFDGRLLLADCINMATVVHVLLSMSHNER